MVWQSWTKLQVNNVSFFFHSASASQSLQFSPSLSRASVPETFVRGGYPRPDEGFVVVMCIDSAGAPANDVTYSIDGNPVPFDVDATTGSLSVTEDLDYETATSYSFAVICENASDPNITGTGMVQINILPVNEFEPVLSRNSFQTTIFESAAVGTTIAANEPGLSRPGVGPLRYTVTDGDDGPDGNITFTLSEGSQDNTENARFFDLNFITGSLVLRQRLDVDNIPNAFDRVALRITACDVYPPGEQCPNLLVDLIVFSANDNTPQFSADTYEVSYPESIPVGTLIITAICTDNDRGAGQFSGIEIYQPTSELWQLPNSQNGTVFLNMSLDYETAQTHEFTLRCFDTGGRQDFATVTINVLPVNDAQPQFIQTSYTFTVNRISSPSNDVAIGRVTAVDHDRDTGGVITYSVEDNENFRISSNDGRIFLVDFILVFEGSSFNLTVVADDGDFNATSLVYITVTGFLSIPEIVLIGLAGLILLVLVLVLACCVLYCFAKWRRR